MIKSKKEAVVPKPWNEQGEMSRVIPLILQPTPELKEMTTGLFRAAVKANRLICPLLRTEPLTNAQGTGWRMLKKIEPQLESFGLVSLPHKEGFMYKLMEGYMSYVAKHIKEVKADGKKKRRMDITDEDKIACLPKRPIRLHPHKAIRLRKSVTRVDATKGSITFEKLFGAGHFDVAYDIPTYFQSWVKYITKESTCNLSRLGKHKMVASYRAKVPIVWSYKPVSTFGIDINKRSNVLVVTSKGKIIPATTEINDVVSQLRQANKDIKNNKKNKSGVLSKERRLLRLKWTNLHQTLHLLIQPIVDEIIQTAKETQSLVCIDMALPGAKNGTYGQDHLTKSLIQKCQNQAIPYVEVPSHWTSSYCSQCGIIYTNKDCRSKDKTQFTCPQHGECHADIMGAKNISIFGWYIWQHGIDKFLEWRNALPKSNEVSQFAF